MAKFYGNVGYGISVETSPDVWTDQVTVRPYFGDEVRWGSSNKSGDKINDDISVTNEISIVADPFAYENFRFIKWVEWLGTKWKVSNVQIERPRLILSLGGVYNA